MAIGSHCDGRCNAPLLRQLEEHQEHWQSGYLDQSLMTQCIATRHIALLVLVIRLKAYVATVQCKSTSLDARQREEKR